VTGKSKFSCPPPQGGRLLKGEGGIGLLRFGRKRKNLSEGLLEITATITSEVNDELERRLDEHALALHKPPYEETELSIVRRDAGGAIVAGLTGKTFWNWLYVDMLWVDDALRGQGVGAALMKAAEEEALRRGCHSAYVWTESFQGPNFYPKLGYKKFVVKDDFPIGHQRLGFMKRLAA